MDTPTRCSNIWVQKITEEILRKSVKAILYHWRPHLILLQSVKPVLWPWIRFLPMVETKQKGMKTRSPEFPARKAFSRQYYNCYNCLYTCRTWKRTPLNRSSAFWVLYHIVIIYIVPWLWKGFSISSKTRKNSLKLKVIYFEWSSS